MEPLAFDPVVRTFKGRAVGLADSEVRFTIDKNTIKGYILTPGEWLMAGFDWMYGWSPPPSR